MYRDREWVIAGRVFAVLAAQCFLLWVAQADAKNAGIWYLVSGVFAIIALQRVILPMARLMELLDGAQNRNLFGISNGVKPDEVMAEGERMIQALGDKGKAP